LKTIWRVYPLYPGKCSLCSAYRNILFQSRMSSIQFEENQRWREAVTLFEAGEDEKALEIFLTLAVTSKAAYNIGVLEMKLELMEDARNAFLTALEMEPGFIVAYLQLGVCHFILQNYEEAARCFQGAIENSQNSTEIDYVHMKLETDLFLEKMNFNLSLCDSPSLTNELPFGGPHRLYMPAPVAMVPKNKTSPFVSPVPPFDPALTTSEQDMRPRAKSAEQVSHSYESPKKTRSNSLGGVLDKLFFRKKRKSKEGKLEYKPQETHYAPITPRSLTTRKDSLISVDNNYPQLTLSSNTSNFRKSGGSSFLSVPIERRPLSSKEQAVSRSSLNAWNIQFDELEIGKEIGRGHFGKVNMARWRGADCCCKFPAKGNIDDVQNDFITEVNNMRKLLHPNICQFFGICLDPLCVVIELMAEGSVINLLQNPSVKMDVSVVVAIAKQTSCGMLYLHGKEILHGDLAARNLLFRTELNSDGVKKYIIKITDFGMSLLTDSLPTCDVSDRKSFPIRWSAPEVLIRREMSKASDVWSFGVLLWELMEREHPYSNLTVDEVIDYVCNQECLLPLPTKIPYPGQLAELMYGCWSWNPTDRPDFSQVETLLEEIEESISSAKKLPPRPRAALTNCPTCYKKLEGTDRFCRFCGTKLSSM